MRLSLAAADYVQSRKLSRTPVYSAKRFVDLMGDLEVSNLDQAAIDKFKTIASGKNWSAWTVKGTIKDIRTLMRHYCGRSVRLEVRVPSPDPQPTDFESINAVWVHAPNWLRQWIVLSYWTCARLDDSLKILLEMQADIGKRTVIEWSASKTGRRHRVPIPEWLHVWLKPAAGGVPFVRANDHAQCVVRATLAGCCTAAKVDQVYPKNLRQRALTEWKRSSPDAGSIIHGSGLGVLDHYVPAIEILSAAMFRVRLPQCFGVVVTDSEELMSAWQRLDPASQKLVKDMAARMAAG